MSDTTTEEGVRYVIQQLSRKCTTLNYFLDICGLTWYHYLMVKQYLRGDYVFKLR